MKACMSETELSRVPVDQIQRDGEDDVDPNVDRDAEVVAVETAGRERDADRGGNGEQEEEPRVFEQARHLHFLDLRFAEQSGGTEEQDQD
jgi:hypothetical protein